MITCRPFSGRDMTSNSEAHARSSLAHRKGDLQSRLGPGVAGQRMIHVSADARQLFDLPPDDFRLEYRVDQVARRFRRLAGAGKQIRLAVAFHARVRDGFDE